MLLPVVTLAVSGLLSFSSVNARIVPRNIDFGLKRDDAPIDDGPPRTKPLLLSIPGLPKLPKVQNNARVAAIDPSINLDDIQGDILIGMQKPLELFYFFSVTDAAAFKTAFKNSVLPLITSTSQILAADATDQPSALVNVAFSSSGLQTLGIQDNIGDSPFAGGQFADAPSLQDGSTDNWVDGFKGTSTHGVLLIASDTTERIQIALQSITAALDGTVIETHQLQGAARPDKQQGHEHFGFLDGVSQPVITGFNDGPATLGNGVLRSIPPGVILLGLDGDTSKASRPSWATGGSLLAFRQLQQLVPEFNKFLLDNPTNGDPELTGARMVGRWKSGAPIDLAPTADDPTLGSDRTRNNLFNYTHPEIPNFNALTDQTRCPFSAHIRKLRLRGDNAADQHQIIRAGIPYGPEVSDDETSSNTTTTERGLAFVSYQSTLNNGFRFQQRIWANNANFPGGKTTPPGFDPIIGQNNGQSRDTSGIDPSDPTKKITLTTDFVQTRGGEYFFSPPISALSSTILA